MHTDMTDFHQNLYEIVSLMYYLGNPSLKQNLNAKDNTFVIGEPGYPLAEISQNSVIFLNRPVSEKYSSISLINDSALHLNKVKSFLTAISVSITGLNHIGIGYNCNDRPREVVRYQQQLVGTNYSLYEEPSSTSSTRWLFVGNREKTGSSFAEIVISQKRMKRRDSWYPHFQIDLDTSLDPSALCDICTLFFGNKFITWKLDVKDYGTVAVMGRLGSFNGINIYLGIGTALRNTQEHRASGLDRISGTIQ